MLDPNEVNAASASAPGLGPTGDNQNTAAGTVSGQRTDLEDLLQKANGSQAPTQYIPGALEPRVGRGVMYIPDESDLGHEGVSLDTPLVALIVGLPKEGHGANLQIFCDSAVTLYKKNVQQGLGPGCWDTNV